MVAECFDRGLNFGVRTVQVERALTCQVTRAVSSRNSLAPFVMAHKPLDEPGWMGCCEETLAPNAVMAPDTRCVSLRALTFHNSVDHPV